MGVSELVANTIGGGDGILAPFVSMLVEVDYLIDIASENITARN